MFTDKRTQNLDEIISYSTDLGVLTELDIPHTESPVAHQVVTVDPHTQTAAVL